ncbi:hypothetical protein DFH08DRAFT_328402 [Mycena albidolilacea]|uniref:Uncharacterized protein n=1 Tax=Mycena albidolilacea TaxID=1033008 RepID=A0AAD7F321_9AGAR|nr:hypothetical protein DFH08DRAFT_328402 [Mycena albidolilacea]
MRPERRPRTRDGGGCCCCCCCCYGGGSTTFFSLCILLHSRRTTILLNCDTFGVPINRMADPLHLRILTPASSISDSVPPRAAENAYRAMPRLPSPSPAESYRPNRLLWSSSGGSTALAKYIHRTTLFRIKCAAHVCGDSKHDADPSSGAVRGSEAGAKDLVSFGGARRQYNGKCPLLPVPIELYLPLGSQ